MSSMNRRNDYSEHVGWTLVCVTQQITIWLSTRRVSRSTSMGDLRHLCSRCSADSDLLSVYLRQVLLQREEEEAAEEDDEWEDQSEWSERKNHFSSGEWQCPLEPSLAQTFTNINRETLSYIKMGDLLYLCFSYHNL